jgi:hypothetical protein
MLPRPAVNLVFDLFYVVPIRQSLALFRENVRFVPALKDYIALGEFLIAIE